ncbi:hypothetical protein ACLB1N_15330 [Escherichia coli]
MHSGMVMVDREKMSKSLGSCLPCARCAEILRRGNRALLLMSGHSQPAELQRREPEAGACGAGASLHCAARRQYENH